MRSWRVTLAVSVRVSCALCKIHAHAHWSWLFLWAMSPEFLTERMVACFTDDHSTKRSSFWCVNPTVNFVRHCAFRGFDCRALKSLAANQLGNSFGMLRSRLAGFSGWLRSRYHKYLLLTPRSHKRYGTWNAVQHFGLFRESDKN